MSKDADLKWVKCNHTNSLEMNRFGAQEEVGAGICTGLEKED